MSLLRLRLGMIGTLALVIAISTLFLSIILSFMGTLNLVTLAFYVLVFNIAQWLVAPYLIDAMYGTRSISESDNPKLYAMIRDLSRKIGVKTPRLMLANIPIPNAFAYGSPIAGSRVAVTSGMLKELEDEEIEAVVGHELGHLKHRDVQVMMMVSVLPAIFYYLGYSMMMSSTYGRGQRRDEGGGGLLALIGIASLAVYWVLTLFVLGLSRMREYYADQTSALTIEDGARKLSEALAKIVRSTGRFKSYYGAIGNTSSFKALFISDPDMADRDEAAIATSRMFSSDQRLVQEILSRKVTLLDKILELFSTHPNIVKRLQALQRLA
jgi:heat shock protein HtpX